ncbi:MAG: hypothetical protein NVV82_19500 [Sporocytophaga sp.]|nr:hypothetical protein [Sporocytophaga sp.]
MKSFWSDWRYEKASISVKADVVSLEIKPVKPTVAKLIYVLAYMRDSKIDTIVHTKNVNYNLDKPLPSIEKLKAEPQYIRYVPESNLKQTSFPNRIIVNKDGAYDGVFRYSNFLIAFVCGLIGYILKRWK